MRNNSGSRRYVGFNERYFGRPSKPGNKQDAHGDPPPVSTGPPVPPGLFVNDPDFQLYVGDVREQLQELPDESVHCVVTSPPYWGLRDYGTGAWDGGDPDCDHMAPPTGGPNPERYTTGGGEMFRAANDKPYSGTCGKCGATRVDQQLGLEPTPEQYVANMVDVFREVRRVLRRDGTCWVNLGDSYARAGGWSDNSGLDGLARGESGRAKSNIGNGTSQSLAPGLKEKDLCGIPWRVAFALQQPYYTGRIKSEADRLWLAAMVDTEGCIHIHKRSAGDKSHTHTLVSGEKVDYARKTDTYGVMVSIDNTSKALIDRIAAIVGQGSRYTHEKGVGKSNRKQTLYRITLTGQQSRELLRELYPHLVGKQQEARIAYHAPSSGVGAEEAWQAIKALHNGEPTTVDYQEPPTLFEPGWYLRSDVIWGKPNPMPESVTDRPTKAHEYVFLLTRSPRYFFDQEAVREDALRAGTIPGGDNSRGAGAFGVKPHGPFNGEVPAGRNVRSVWEIATQPYPEAHFATFPEALPERCIKAGTSERGCCPECGAPWVREVERVLVGGHAVPNARPMTDATRVEPGRKHTSGSYDVATLGWRPSCACDKGDTDVANNDSLPVSAKVVSTAQVVDGSDGRRDCFSPAPCVVLDPFMGSGTTALVARRLGRKSIGIELNPSYAELCARRLQQLSLFAGATDG
jgi:DNA modification methylase